MTNCEKVRQLVWQDPESLPSKLMTAVALHLANCNSCEEWLSSKIPEWKSLSTKEDHDAADRCVKVIKDTVAKFAKE